MHHFTKRIKKKLWFHIALPFGSALITVALLDFLSSFLWFVNDFTTKIPTFGIEDKFQHRSLGIRIFDIFQWIYVSYRVTLSLVLCIGGIFMGRRLIVIIWLLVSIMVDLVHLSESIFIISKPNLITTWTLLLTATASIWSDLKIVRIKYRIIRRSLTTTSILNTVQNRQDDLGLEKCDSQDLEEMQQETSFMSFKVNLVSLIKLIRNLYNLMTWHLASFYSEGEDFHKLLKNNHSAIILEQNFIRYAHIFLDSLTVVYIIQEKKFLLTPWIAVWILGASATIAISVFVMQQFNVLTSVFSSIYYLVFSIDLFLRSGFVIYCLQLIIKTRHII